ncbi:MAG: hypothetical protein FWG36_02050 [Oscillospiraceae bacterium]|nr:hypothetical protein [Oscillospiraceae bacterium]
MKDLTISELASIIGILMLIGSCLLGMFKIWYEFKKIKGKSEHRQEDIEILLICMRGCLEGLVANGSNGKVADALKQLNEYQAKKTSGRGG